MQQRDAAPAGRAPRRVVAVLSRGRARAGQGRAGGRLVGLLAGWLAGWLGRQVGGWRGAGRGSAPPNAVAQAERCGAPGWRHTTGKVRAPCAGRSVHGRGAPHFNSPAGPAPQARTPGALSAPSGAHTWVHWLTSGSETTVMPALRTSSSVTASSSGGWKASELPRDRGRAGWSNASKG